MVYENFDGETRRRLPIPDTDIYFHDLDVSLLQASRFVLQEAAPTMRCHRYLLVPCLSLPLGPAPPSADVSNPLFYVRQIVRMLVHERQSDLRRIGPKAVVSDEVSTVGLQAFDGRMRSVLNKADYDATKSICLHPNFKAFYRRTARQLRSTPALVVRVLLNLESPSQNPLEDMKRRFWRDLDSTLRGKFKTDLELKFIFIVLPQHAQRCRDLLVERGRLPAWFTEEMWSIEVSNRGLDPAID